MTITQGQAVRIQATFLDANKIPFDPQQVRLTVKAPSRIDMYNAPTDVDHDGAGVYSKRVVCSVPGTWTYKWQSLLDAEAATDVGSFIVVPDGF